MAEKNNTIDAGLLLRELQGNSENTMTVKDLFYLCLAKWRWFAVSVLFVVGVAVLYILRTPPVYTRSALVMVKEDSKGRSIGSDISSLFADLGLTQANANVNNELLAMQTPAAILETIKRLNLDIDYRTDGIFRKETLYGMQLPVKVALPELADNESAAFTLRLLPDGKIELDDFESSEREFDSKTVTGALNDTLASPLGRIAVTPTAYWAAEEEYPPIHVTRTNLYACTDDCRKRLTAELSSEDATVIELSYKDVSIPRAEDVLNTLISVYNEEWIRDKNQITVSTSMFITERLGALERELGDVDTDISSYKSSNLLPDAEKVSELYLEQSQEAKNQLLMLGTQISMARYIRDYLTGGKNRNQLLPVNSGLESPGIEAQISEYNALQLRRNNLVSNSSEQNPLIVDLDHSLAAMRGAIVNSIDNLVVSLDTRKSELERSEQRTTARIAANPDQAKYLQTVGRQQKVKEALYLFLLQKREENELSQAFTAYNIRMLTPPMGNLEPVAPRKKLILMAALCLGLFIPLVVIYMRETMNTAVRGRKDLGKLPVPFIGEIPLYTDSTERKRRFRKLLRLSGKQLAEQKRIVVKEGKRDVVNEAFRVLRTNLEFMTGDTTEVILLTSYNPGSGKTFLTMNIAASLAIKGKNVLVIDGDLRHASLSAYAGTSDTGLSDYLAGRIAAWQEIVRKVDERYKGLDIIPVGTIPPNPTELLFGKRLEQLITQLRQGYDYIFIDCPPVEIVADTLILEKVADRTFFVVRAGLLERSMLAELEQLYRQKKLRNMAVVLNGTEPEAGRYGYRYGYKYGYRYGYGNETDKS
ncbi:MAG: polysaccharide biosynthesis tyrosine autokinase [Alistipes shahii]|nr:polysaccharide biosynthesis tyrosine autokinase [Alistipes shahii]